MERPQLSIVVPTFNCAALLERCLASLLVQTVRSYEVVVVDDGSTDRTPALLAQLAAQHPHLRWIRQENAGPARARNAGVKESTADLIAFTDSDCVAAPDWVERYLAAFQAHPSALGVEGRTVTDLESVTPFTHQIENLSGGTYCTANMAYRRAPLLAAGVFDEDFFYGHEDTDLSLRIRARGTILFDPTVLVTHPPVPMTFWQMVRRPRVWMCQIVLYIKHPEIYIQGHNRGPFGVLLWHYGVRQLLERLGRFRGWLVRDPLLFARFCLALLLQRLYMLAYFPAYVHRYWTLKASVKR